MYSHESPEAAMDCTLHCIVSWYFM